MLGFVGDNTGSDAVWVALLQSDVFICMELMTTCLDKLMKELQGPIPEDMLGKMAVAVRTCACAVHIPGLNSLMPKIEAPTPYMYIHSSSSQKGLTVAQVSGRETKHTCTCMRLGNV